MSHITITIDGGSGVGKGTISKALAQKLEYQLIDSGAMYRAVTYFLSKRKIESGDVESADVENISFFYIDSILNIKLNSESFEVEKLPIRTKENSINTSNYATNRIIRDHVTKQIRKIMSHGGYILEGRDAGSVIAPNSQVKFYIECPIEIRAKRRLEDYKKKGILYTTEEVQKELEERDHVDLNRETDPLVIPNNAYIITNDDSLSLEQRVEQMRLIVKSFN